MPLKLYEKEQIIQACLSVFARYGYVNTSTSMLAAAAGVSKSLLFHHFKSKKQLYFNVLDRCLIRGNNEMDFKNLFQEEFFQALETSGTVKFSYYRNNPDSYKVVREAFFSTPEELKENIEDKYGAVPANIDKGWERSFQKVHLRDGVERARAFKLVMLTMDYFDSEYLAKLADNKNLDETRFRNFLDERSSFLNMIRFGIEKPPASKDR